MRLRPSLLLLVVAFHAGCARGPTRRERMRATDVAETPDTSGVPDTGDSGTTGTISGDASASTEAARIAAATREAARTTPTEVIRRRYDPYAGMDPNGRIPKIELPDHVKNPERWRYIPEARILDGNIFQRFLVTSVIAPTFSFDSDVGAGGGVSITDIDFRNQRRREFAGIFLSYTSEGQQDYQIRWRRWLNHEDLPGGGVIQEERSFLSGRLGYTRTLTNRFFGLGPETRESDETSYTDEVTQIGMGIDQSFPEAGDDIVYGFGVGYEHHNIGPGRVSSKPTTTSVFPDLTDDGDDHDGLWMRGNLRFDTRDSQHNPYKGFTVGIAGRGAPLQTDWDAGAVFRLFASGVIKVPGLFHNGGDEDEENPPTDVVAAGAYIEDTVGDLPFWALPTLGGRNTLRGYINNRFTDESAWHAALEYRFWAIPRGFRITDRIRVERLGMAPFVEVGSVDRELDELLKGRKIRYSWGVGFRAAFERAAVLRADLGFSPEGLNVSAGFGMSF